MHGIRKNGLTFSFLFNGGEDTVDMNEINTLIWPKKKKKIV